MKGLRYTRAALFAAVAPCVLACAAQTVIYEKTSQHNAIVVTEDHNGLRTLLFERGGSRQSVVKPGDPDHLELPYARVALVGLALCEEPRRILVVGLGGGTLPTFLRKHYPSAAIDVAEIDPDVVDVAKKLFGFREDERMRAHVGDGRRFIENVPQPYYDIIYLDADHSYSSVLRDATCAIRKLNPDGLLIFNDYVSYDHLAHTPYGIVHVVNDLCVNQGWKITHFAFEQNMFCDVAIRRALLDCTDHNPVL